MKEFEWEFEWIDRYFKPLTRTTCDDAAHTSWNLTDDGALLNGHVVVTDSLFEGTHFLADDDPEQVARLLSRVNVSDCAAMGARPLCYWLNVGVPRASAQQWMESLARGLALEQKIYGMTLMGGDSGVVSRHVALSMTLVGHLDGRAAVRRSGVQPNDIIAVTGTLGDGGFAWHLASGGRYDGEHHDFFHRARLLPTPPVAFAAQAAHLLHGAVDVSDGLWADVTHLATASSVGIDIRVEDLPLSPQLTQAVAPDDAYQYALTGGGDYQLVVAVARDNWQQLQAIAKNNKVSITPIGTARVGEGVTLHHERLAEFHQTGFQHF